MNFDLFFVLVGQTTFGKLSIFEAPVDASFINLLCYVQSLMKTRGFPEAHRHYAVSMEFVWSLIKSAIVLWRGMADQTLATYLCAIDFACKTAPTDFRSDEDWELLGNVLILMSGSVKCCDQSTLVLFAEAVD